MCAQMSKQRDFWQNTFNISCMITWKIIMLVKMMIQKIGCTQN